MSDEAKALTTAEVEGWQANLGQHWAAKIGPLWNEVVIEGDRILATTRALEALAAERDEAPNWGVVRRLNDEWTEEAEKLLARAEKAERELADISSQTVDGSVVAKMSRKSLERFAVRLHQERNAAERERDETLAALAKTKGGAL